MIVLAPLTTFGSPKANPEPVRPKDRGSGKTGCGWSPKTRPENHRLVGGTSPALSRVTGSGLTVRLVIAPTADCTCAAGKTAVPLAVGPGVGVVVPRPALQAVAPAATTRVAASTRRAVLRVVAMDRVFDVARIVLGFRGNRELIADQSVAGR